MIQIYHVYRRKKSSTFNWKEYIIATIYMQAVEGIILQTVRLQEKSEIVTLFSKEQGIISLVVKRQRQALSPLLKVEAEIRPSEKELKKCFHIQVTSSFQGLRLSLEKLQYASKIIQWISKELPRSEAVEPLYELFDTTLRQLCEEKDATQVAIRFMKAWKQHDGSFSSHYSDADLIKEL